MRYVLIVYLLVSKLTCSDDLRPQRARSLTHWWASLSTFLHPFEAFEAFEAFEETCKV